MTDADVEYQLWKILEAETADDPTRTVRLAQHGCDRLPTHKEQITNIIANWRNRGLVHTTQADTRVTLTDKGRFTDKP